MLRTLARGQVEITVEARDGFDGQGAPSYAAPVTICVVARHEHTVVYGLQGIAEEFDLTVYVPECSDVAPRIDDRVTLGDRSYTVRRRSDIQHLSGEPSHIELKAREV